MSTPCKQYNVIRTSAFEHFVFLPAPVLLTVWDAWHVQITLWGTTRVGRFLALEFSRIRRDHSYLPETVTSRTVTVDDTNLPLP